MAPLPKRRWSTRRQGKKRASFVLKNPKPGPCPNCGDLKSPHIVCQKCGFYKGREVIKIKSKSNKQK